MPPTQYSNNVKAEPRSHMLITQNMSRKCIVTFFRICKLGLIKIKNKHLDFHWDYIHWGYSIFIKNKVQLQ